MLYTYIFLYFPKEYDKTKIKHPYMVQCGSGCHRSPIMLSIVISFIVTSTIITAILYMLCVLKNNILRGFLKKILNCKILVTHG